jgi:hypothetical protein
MSNSQLRLKATDETRLSILFGKAADLDRSVLRTEQIAASSQASATIGPKIAAGKQGGRG